MVGALLVEVDVGLIVVLGVDSAGGVDDEEEVEELVLLLEILNGEPVSGYAVPMNEHAASPALGDDW